MINRLGLKFGRTPTSALEAIDLGSITVFVGPNNSGKSKLLQEIHGYCMSGQRDESACLLDTMEFEGAVDLEQANGHVERYRLEPMPNQATTSGHIWAGRHGGRQQLPHIPLIDSLLKPNAHAAQFCQWFLRYHVLKIDGRGRIDLVDQQSAGDLQQPPSTTFQALFRDDAKRAEVRRILNEAFGTYFVLDPTNIGNLRIRFSERAPTSNFEERGFHSEAVSFHSEATPVDQLSDGVKAFTGIIIQLLAGDPEVLLIDEPEAFLHPSLAFKLGTEIAKLARGNRKRVFVSTHSPNFLMGCIQSGVAVNIVRLTYRAGVATGRVLPSRILGSLMKDPLLRSIGVLGGLFYEFVVVTEGDTDRAFYQEINERLLALTPQRGIPNCVFLNAQNKQTVKNIIGPLRDLGIPAAGIVDVDVLKEGGTVWNSLLESANVPQIDRDSLNTARIRIKSCFDTTGKNMKLDGGVDLLDLDSVEAANNLFDRLAEYGIFVVRKGEIESWLKGLGSPGHGTPWLIDIFKKMGSDPADGGYVHPAPDDVWKFVEQIRLWLVNPHRKGIPI